MKPSTKCGRVHFEHRHRKWLVITVRPTTSVRKSPRKNLPSRNTPDSFCRLLHPTKSIAALRGRYFSFMVTCRGGGPSILLTQDRSVAQKPHWGFCCCANASLPWQAEQAHLAGREKQEVPVGELPAVHIAVVCGLNRKFYKQRNSQRPICDMQFTVVINESNRELRWQGASYSGAHPVFVAIFTIT